MAINCLEYSPSYQKTVTRPVRERHAIVASRLDSNYYTPGEGRITIELIQSEMGMRRGFSKHGFYDDFRMYRTIYQKYLTADEQRKAEIIAKSENDHLLPKRDPTLHAIWCLAQDGIRTMDDVMQFHAQTTSVSIDSQPSPKLMDIPAAEREETPVFRAEDLPETVIQNGNERIAAVTALLAPVKDLFLVLIQENIAFKEEIAKRGRELAFRDRLLAEYKTRLHGNVVMDAKLFADAEEIARELDNTAWAQINRLPLRTNPEKWHGHAMEIIYGPIMRENFESKHWAPERKRIREHLNRYAEEGRGHNSFFSKVFDTEKGDPRRPGVPEDTKRYWWNRVSDGIRFYTETKGEKLFVYNIEPKESMS